MNQDNMLKIFSPPPAPLHLVDVDLFKSSLSEAQQGKFVFQ